MLGNEVARLNAALCDNIEIIRELEEELEARKRELARSVSAAKKTEESLKDSFAHLERENERISDENSKLLASISLLKRKIEDLKKQEL